MAHPLQTHRLLLVAPLALSMLAAPHARAAAASQAAPLPVRAEAAPQAAPLSARADAAAPPASVPARTAATPASAPARAGTIEGVVRLDVRPARRTASRYPGQPAVARAVQQLPAVVWITGALPGVAPSPPADAAIAQQDTAFTPGVLVVPVGTSVAFPNRDAFFHNVFSFSPTRRFDLGRYPRGESKTVTFEEPGVVKVYCEVHESMRALVVVTENPLHAVVGPDGRFTLTGVPAGRHSLMLLHADLGTRQVDVEVRNGGVARVSLELP